MGAAREFNSRMLERRAVDAVIWGLPLVGQHAVRQAAFRDGKAKFNDIVWWPKGSWNQSPTPTRYQGRRVPQGLYDEANKQGWTVVSMKNDWKKIFVF